MTSLWWTDGRRPYEGWLADGLNNQHRWPELEHYVISQSGKGSGAEESVPVEVGAGTPSRYRSDPVPKGRSLPRQSVGRSNLTATVQRGVYPVGNESQTEVSNWDLSNPFFFVGAMVSTIGYGTQCPKTVAGQIFCVFFASFGIPLTIVFLHRVSKMLSLLCERLERCLYERGMKRKKIKFLTLLFFLVMGILVFLGLPSVVFQVVEGWSYSEGFYFAFITLSTIGFGDYVVGKENSTSL
ncbi:potassium channel subfamily K member 16-like [Gopherus flavomarginatus]|uniref:potassium channel subfamily K member 16-like n=1 Tax=Gopherus flavomarginatus TaxID=286002 RepID=UPI0021CBC680|nr:potassium channel subfamily K member 16-like [Gopherus flavomarginatus]